MRTHRGRRELVAWISGAVLGAIIGLALGTWSAPPVGIVVGVVLGLLIALSVRRGRGAQGWSDVDGESHVGAGTFSESTHRGFVKGTPSAADLPVTPGMGIVGRGPYG